MTTTITQADTYTIRTTAGVGTAGFSGDGGQATSAQLNAPAAVAVSSTGEVYIADWANQRVRKVTTAGKIITIAGTGVYGKGPDGVQATSSPLAAPWGVTVDDRTGDVYITDRDCHRIRKVDGRGIITTIAGTGIAGSSGDGGQATSAQLHFPWGLDFGGPDNALYVADQINCRIRKIDVEHGHITTVAGTGVAGFSGDQGPATSAQLNGPADVAVSDAGALFIADWVNQRVRKVDPDGTITTIAGNGIYGKGDDSGQATSTPLAAPWGVAVEEGSGDVYITDRDCHRIRKVDGRGIITTIAGTGVAGFSGDGGQATSAQLYFPWGLDFGGPDNALYVADQINQRIRKIASSDTPPPPLRGADLYGEPEVPATVARGSELNLGVRVRNRGPETASGDTVWVTLTLPETMGIDPSTRQRRFPGAQLPPDDGSLDGVFRIYLPDDVALGEYIATARIEYTDETYPSDNTYRLPFTVVARRGTDDETALTVQQISEPQAAPGESAKFNVKLSAPPGRPVNPGKITQRFTAPTGFLFDREATYGYYESTNGAHAGNLDDYDIEDGGRTLVIRSNPHVNTDPRGSDRNSVVYTFPVRARHDAQPGTYSNGSAVIGKHEPISVTGTVSGQDLTVHQVDTLSGRPGDSAQLNVEIAARHGRTFNPGVIKQRFTAPTGFVFSGGASYGYYYSTSGPTGNLDTRVEDGGRTLIVTSNPHLNTSESDKIGITYTINMSVLQHAPPGEHSDGTAVIGSYGSARLSGTVTA